MNVEKVYQIFFECPKCGDSQTINEAMSGMLSLMWESGWPICVECDADMDFKVME